MNEHSGPVAPEEDPEGKNPLVTQTVLSVGFALAGFAELLLTYLALQSRLPARIPVHFGTNGVPDGFSSPAGFLDGFLVTLGLLATLMTIAVAATSASDTMDWEYRGRSFNPILVVDGAVIAGSLPLTGIALLLGAAALLPSPGWTDGVALAAAVAPLVVAGAFLAWARLTTKEPLLPI